MEISPTLAAAAAPMPPQATASEISSDFETFLRMLTVQMQNQDPLNPVDSSDYAVQLATFSGVEQQVLTNDLLRGIAAQAGTSGLAQMAGWVGMEARAATPAYFDGAPLTLAPQPAQFATSAQIVVRDAQGLEVQRFDIGTQAETISWAGVKANGQPLPNGVYQFETISFEGANALQQDTTAVYGRVTEVRMENGEAMLTLAGGQTIAAGAVTALREPGS
ncbi:flagellar basal-body rod modification protein FlgD [Cognatiyoonia koreensis]|uniref:Basal-body rod modification protein FlgD n=1 Tax=Cognatiyoonia koreensis TaxID=364200 RepID=A0A1I0RJH5_9RHOB|nr:flagellar hook capping FlgD N-terminal domain-containing protein [Cognatiyoonia koreensis]SEW41160.1 flagellar basal-body rod modification protein FlgD [Cognatiyoonia koreensis]